VVSLEEGVGTGSVPIVITSLPRAVQLKCALRDLGVEEHDIFSPSYSYEEILR
jgi:hypothetical protein